MRPADTWVDYELIDATNHNRLERWGKTLLILSLIHISEPTRRS